MLRGASSPAPRHAVAIFGHLVNAADQSQRGHKNFKLQQLLWQHDVIYQNLIISLVLSETVQFHWRAVFESDCFHWSIWRAKINRTHAQYRAPKKNDMLSCGTKNKTEEEEETVKMEPVAAGTLRQIIKSNPPISSIYLSFRAFALDFFAWKLIIRFALMLFYPAVTSILSYQPNHVEIFSLPSFFKLISVVKVSIE